MGRILKDKRIRIGNWVRVRKVGIDGVYQVKGVDDHGRVLIEQNDHGYKHKMRVEPEELIKV